jgi:hypothetical protein
VGLLYVAKAVQTASQGNVPLSSKSKSSNAECLNAVIAREKDNLLRSVAEIANYIGNEESFSDSEESGSSSSSSIPVKSSRSDINSRITRRMQSSSAILKDRDEKKEESKKKEDAKKEDGKKEEDDEFLIFIETLSHFRQPIAAGVKKLDPDWLPVLRELYAVMDKWIKM